jgi:alkanesulfonate monooxygenase SsuD/methylene tetrahydromethanopterin reductase-like flavin-dependent oxidoreductase (luciferase family)
MSTSDGRLAFVPTGLFVPIFDELADPAAMAKIAVHAEERGWDGVFVWDHIAYRPPVEAIADPWITLAAIAAATTAVRLGPLVTPLPRRRPAVVARATATLDRLSGGRFVLGVGIGGDNSQEFSGTREETEDRARGRMLDEHLSVLARAWSGDPVRHLGEHYTVDGIRFLPTPVQRPRPPVWVAARFGNPAPLRRAARWDGAFPIDMSVPDQLSEVVQQLRHERGDLTGYDVVASGPPGTDPAPWVAAGATWWLTAVGIDDCRVDTVAGVVRDGPG